MTMDVKVQTLDGWDAISFTVVAMEESGGWRGCSLLVRAICFIRAHAQGIRREVFSFVHINHHITSHYFVLITTWTPFSGMLY